MTERNSKTMVRDTVANGMSVVGAGLAPENSIASAMLATGGFLSTRIAYATNLDKRQQKGEPTMFGNPFNFNPKQRIIDLCINEKYLSDLAESSTRSWRDMRSHTRDTIAIARRNGTLKADDKRIANILDVKTIDPIAFLGRMPSQHVKTLADFGKIRIAITATSVGVLAKLRSLRDQLEDWGIDLQIDSSFQNGVDQVNHLCTTEDPDFAVIIDAPYFYNSDLSSAQDYVLVCALTRDPNVVLHSKNTRASTLQKVYFVPKSSAHETIDCRTGLYREDYYCELAFPDVDHVLQNLDVNMGIVAWSALGAFRRNSSSIIASKPVHHSYRSLIRHVRLDDRPDVVQAFVSLIVGAMNSLDEHDLSRSGLLQDRAFRSVFSAGMGEF